MSILDRLLSIQGAQEQQEIGTLIEASNRAPEASPAIGGGDPHGKQQEPPEAKFRPLSEVSRDVVISRAVYEVWESAIIVYQRFAPAIREAVRSGRDVGEVFAAAARMIDAIGSRGGDAAHVARALLQLLTDIWMEERAKSERPLFLL